MPGDQELRIQQKKEELNREWIEYTNEFDAAAIEKLKVLARDNVTVKNAKDETYDEKINLQIDVNFMNNALEMEKKNDGLLLAPKTRERLKVNKSRKTSQLLLNSQRSIVWWDSDEMRDVKNSVKDLEDFLARDHAWQNEEGNIEIPKATDDDLKSVEQKYERAIQACRNYLEVKTTKTGTGRYNLVRTKMLSLMEEHSAFTTMRTVIKSQTDLDWTKVRNYADLLWSFNLNKLVEKVADPKPVSEEYKNNQKDNKIVNHNINKETLDPGAKLILELLCVDPALQSLDVQGQDKLDNINIASYILNVLTDLQAGPKAIYFHSAFAGYRGRDTGRKYRDSHNKKKTGHTAFMLIHDTEGKLYMSVNGDEKIELKGIQTIIADVRNKLIMSETMINQLHEMNPEAYAANLGTSFVNSVMFFTKNADYEKNEAPEGFRENAIYYIQGRYAGIDQSRFDKINNEDLRKLVVMTLNGKASEDKMLREIAKLNNEKHWTDEVYKEDKVKAEDVDENDKVTLDRIKESALAYLSQVTYMSEAMFSDKKPLELHALAMRLITRQANPEEIKREIRAEKGGKYYVEVKGDAGKYINSKEARDIINRWENRDKEKVTVEFKEKEEVQAEKIGELKWTDDETQIKTFVSNLVFSGNAISIDKQVESGEKGSYFKELVKNDQSLRTVALMLKDPNMLTATLEKIPFITNAKDFSDKLLQVFKGWLTLENSGINLDKSVDEITSQIKELLKDNGKRADIQAEDNLNQLVEGFAQSQIESIQKIIDDVLMANFGGAKKMREKPESSREDGISHEDKKKRVEDEREWLTEYLQQHVTTGNDGQAKFLKEVLGHYFGNISSMDQRAVIAYMLREAKPAFKPDETSNDKKKQYLEKSKESCLAGMFKGAGPLLQKTLQGMPTEGIPALLKYAIEDTRSRLLPISKEFVQAQLHELVLNSDGKITKIEITKSLGAASVGQAFLVKVYGPNMQQGVDHVVKILRPDATNRMEREKAIFEECARVVDNNESNAMQTTFRNTYQRIHQELNFEIEIANAKKGKKHYDTTQIGSANDDHVHSMNVSNLTKANKNVMLIELAPGKTVDKDTTDIENEIYNALIGVYGFDDSKKLVHDNKSSFATPTFYKRVIEQLTPVLKSTQKKQKHLIALAEKWITESIISSEGFYHGDLHAGNIMVDENGATVIDYGNATSLTKNQQDNMLKLIATSAGGLRVADKFVDAFEALLFEDNKDENVRNAFAEKKELFRQKVDEFLDMGDDTDAVLRMSILTAEAQKMGFPLPTAVANYLQCQLRFKNTIEAYNKLITDMQAAIKTAEECFKTSADETIYSMEMWMRNLIAVADNDEEEYALKKYGQRVIAQWYAREKGGLEVLLDQTSPQDQKLFDDIFLGEEMGEIPAKLQALRKAQADGAEDETINALKTDLIKAFNDDFALTADISDRKVLEFNDQWEDEDGAVSNPCDCFNPIKELGMLKLATNLWRERNMNTGLYNYEYLEKLVEEKKDQALTTAFHKYKDAADAYWDSTELNYREKNQDSVTDLLSKVLVEMLRLEIPNIKGIKRMTVDRKEYSKDKPGSFMMASGNVIRNNQITILGRLFWDAPAIRAAMIDQDERLGYYDD